MLENFQVGVTSGQSEGAYRSFLGPLQPHIANWVTSINRKPFQVGGQGSKSKFWQSHLPS